MVQGILDLDVNPPNTTRRIFTVFDTKLPAFDAVSDIWHTIKNGNQLIFTNAGMCLPAKTVMPWTCQGLHLENILSEVKEIWKNVDLSNHKWAWYCFDTILHSDINSVFLSVDDSVRGEPRFKIFTNTASFTVSEVLAIIDTVMKDLPNVSSEGIQSNDILMPFTPVKTAEQKDGQLFDTMKKLNETYAGKYLLSSAPMKSMDNIDSGAPTASDVVNSNVLRPALPTPSVNFTDADLTGFTDQTNGGTRVTPGRLSAINIGTGTLAMYKPLDLIADKMHYRIQGMGIDYHSRAAAYVYAMVAAVCRVIIMSILTCDKIFLPLRATGSKISLKDLWIHADNVQNGVANYAHAWRILTDLALDDKGLRLEPAYTQFFYGMRWLRTAHRALFNNSIQASWMNPIESLINEPAQLLPIYGISNVALRFSEQYGVEQMDVIEELNYYVNKLTGVISTLKDKLNGLKPNFVIQNHKGDDLLSAFRANGLEPSRILSVEGLPVVGQIPMYGDRMFFVEGIEPNHWLVSHYEEPIKLQIQPLRSLLWRTTEPHRVLWFKEHVVLKYGVGSSDTASLASDTDSFVFTGPSIGRVGVPVTLIRDYRSTISKIFPISIGSTII